MADNFLERHREDYERRKKAWLMRKRHIVQQTTTGRVMKPDDESL